MLALRVTRKIIAQLQELATPRTQRNNLSRVS